MIGLERHEGVLFCSDPDSGLRAFIGIHNTVLGPGLGGCRMKAYASEEEALRDVLLLSRAMTYKNAMAGLNYGGGKTVVIIDRPEQKTPALLGALAQRINLLKGSYYGAGDIGSNADDLREMKKTTPYLGGTAIEDGGLGDSSTLTGLGVYLGIKAAVKEKLGRDDLDGVKVSIQGTGKVGYYTMGHLLKEGAQVVACDVVPEATERIRQEFPQVKIVPQSEIFAQEVDVFSPNAIGGVITEEIARTMQVKAVAGGANNPLATVRAGEILHERGILFAPDYVVNAGGVTLIACEIEGLTLADATRKTERIYDTTLRVFEAAKRWNVTPIAASNRLAEERIAEAKKPKATA
jgi:glutamate dehydrogenase/leucine dehydrogenase